MRVLVVVFLLASLVAATFDAAAPDDPAAVFAHYQSLVAERGDEVPAELWYDVALTALAVDRPREVEVAAERMAIRGGEDWYARRDFFLGNASWRRSLRSEMLANRPEGGLPELDAAVAYVRAARDHWARAHVRHDPGRAALRNVERAVRRLTLLLEVRARKVNASARDERTGGGESEEDLPGGETETENAEETAPEEEMTTAGAGDSPLDSSPETMTRELSLEQVRDLAGKLDSKRQEKRRVRRDLLRDRARGGGDW